MNSNYTFALLVISSIASLCFSMYHMRKSQALNHEKSVLVRENALLKGKHLANLVKMQGEIKQLEAA